MASQAEYKDRQFLAVIGDEVCLHLPRTRFAGLRERKMRQLASQRAGELESQSLTIM